MLPEILTLLVWAIGGAIIFFFGAWMGSLAVKHQVRCGFIFIDGHHYFVRLEE